MCVLGLGTLCSQFKQLCYAFMLQTYNHCTLKSLLGSNRVNSEQLLTWSRVTKIGLKMLIQQWCTSHPHNFGVQSKEVISHTNTFKLQKNMPLEPSPPSHTETSSYTTTIQYQQTIMAAICFRSRRQTERERD